MFVLPTSGELVSFSITDLRAGMRWWFEASNHDVKIGILAKFYRATDPQQHRLLLEKWVETPEPTLSQEITIHQTPANRATGAPASYVVNGGPLRLEFSRLFLRNPRHWEQDIIISVQELQGYAVDVWESLL
jgi:uncharacterized protein (DUF924 family)